MPFNKVAQFTAGALSAFLAQIFCWWWTGHFMSFIVLGIIVIVVSLIASFIDGVIKTAKKS